MPGTRSTEEAFRRAQSTIWGVVLLFVLAPAWILLFLPAWLAAWCLVAWALQITTVLWWLPRGRRVIFVYSNSPVWQDYVERNILPRLPPAAVVLNYCIVQ